MDFNNIDSIAKESAEFAKKWQEDANALLNADEKKIRKNCLN